MKRTCAILLALSASLALIVALAPGETPWAAPPPGVLLLRNGRTLEGKIARDGDFYLIARPQGEVRLRADQVEAAFSGFAECYHFKRSRLFTDSPDDRLELAGWCISHRLLDEAGAELAEVSRNWPQHPRIALVRRRLDAARQPPTPVATVGEQIAAPSDEELAGLMKSLPRGTMEAFTGTVQPILQMHCAAAGCHGPGSTSRFRLERISPEHVTGKLSQRNLLAVLNEIDARSPKTSPLLERAKESHGSAKGPIFAEHELSRYHQLAAFVNYAKAAGRAAAAKAEAADSTSGKVAAQPASFVREGDERAPTEQPDFEESVRPAAADELLPPADVTPPEREDRSASKLVPVPVDHSLGFAPRDPYDPEIFNRKYGTKPKRN